MSQSLLSSSSLRIVLLCKGQGGDSSSYRPQRDESQWWNRRDALVRCVASTLSSSSAKEATRTELVLLFEDDYARFHMTMMRRSEKEQLETNDKEEKDKTVNSSLWKEQSIIALWKESSQHPNRTIASSSSSSLLPSGLVLTCRCALSSSSSKRGASITEATNVDENNNKRQVLDRLQSECSLDFLRQHGLNSNTSVVLRKTNRRTLVKLWHQWRKQHQQPSNRSEPKATSPLKDIFTELLQPNHESTNVVAGILHESCSSELPCYLESRLASLASTSPQCQVCLFLGAVRDMHPSENRMLHQCCQQSRIPLVKVRLGPVAEFTSKILSVVSFHHANHRLIPSILQLSQADKNNDNNQNQSAAAPATSKRSLQSLSLSKTFMHVLCFVPMSSSQVTTDLPQRSRVMWALVRVIVCTLWRSRLAAESASSSMSPLETALTFVFQTDNNDEDDIAIRLDQQQLVTSMAEQHQAAPSEHQILSALCKQIKQQQQENQKPSADPSSHVRDASAVLYVDRRKKASLANQVYNASAGEQEGDEPVRLLVCFDLGESSTGEKKVLRKACRKRNVPFFSTNLVDGSCTDWEAATVTMLQHLSYQRLLAPLLKSSTRRRDHRKKAKLPHKGDGGKGKRGECTSQGGA